MRRFLVIDLETAVPGARPDPEQDRIISLGITCLTVDKDTKQLDVLPERRFNPGFDMDDTNIAIHGITNEELKDCPTFEDACEDIMQTIRGHTLAGFNLRAYDIPVLWHEFARCEMDWDWRQHNIIDAYTLLVKREPRDLKAAIRFYLGEEQDEAHSATKDTEYTARILAEQLSYYNLHHLTNNELAQETAHSQYLDISRKITVGDDGRATFAFGKHRGDAVIEQQAYARWMLEKGAFTADTKRVLLDVLCGTIQ